MLLGDIILTPRGETIRESGNGNEPDSLAIRNVAGENAWCYVCSTMGQIKKWVIIT